MREESYNPCAWESFGIKKSPSPSTTYFVRLPVVCCHQGRFPFNSWIERPFTAFPSRAFEASFVMTNLRSDSTWIGALYTLFIESVIVSESANTLDPRPITIPFSEINFWPIFLPIVDFENPGIVIWNCTGFSNGFVVVPKVLQSAVHSIFPLISWPLREPRSHISPMRFTIPSPQYGPPLPPPPPGPGGIPPPPPGPGGVVGGGT